MTSRGWQICLAWFCCAPTLEFRAHRAYLGADQHSRSGNMARTNPLKFIQQVRAEAAKIVWPSRRETLVTTAMVFVMAALTATFFFIVDQIIRLGLQFILGLVG